MTIVIAFSLLSSFSLLFALEPSAPSNLQAVAGYGKADLTWEAPVEENELSVTDYVIEYSISGDNDWHEYDDGESTDETATVEGLTPELAYDFQVIAVNDDGRGEPSEIATATILDPAPHAPVSLSAVAGDTVVSLSWTPAAWAGESAVIDYIVEYRISGETEWTTFADTESTDAEADVTSLTNGTSYEFRVSAVNDTKISAPSVVQTATPRTTPGVPTSVSAQRGNASAEVSFVAPVDNGGAAITSYTVTSNPGGITATGANSPITVTGLTNGTEYTFTVIASNAAGDGTASSASNAVTPATTPGAPTAVTGTPDNGQVSVAFNAPESNGGAAITSYTVTSNPGGITATGESSPIVIAGLTNGTNYTFTVTATNAIGDGDVSAASSNVVPRTTPGAPTSVTAVRGNGQATVTFGAPVDNGGAAISGYTVTSDPGGLTATGTSSPITVTGLANGTEYTFTVVATNAAGSGSSSSESNSVTPATTPGAPTGLTATRGLKQIELTWSAPANNGAEITDYIISYSPSGEDDWTVFADGTSTTTAAVVTDLTDAIQYDFRIAALNDVGTSSYATITAMTFARPGAPTAVTGTPGNCQVSVAFSAPASDGGTTITEYTVISNPGGLTATGVSSPITLTGLTNGTEYTFTVVATNIVGDSDASDASSSVTPRTVPGAVVNVEAQAGNTEVSLSWSAPVSDGGSEITDYVVQYSQSGEDDWTTFSDDVTTDTEANVTGLTNGVAYDFRIAAVNAAGVGQASDNVVATPRTTPGVPTSVSAQRGNASAEVSFVAPVDNGGAAITSYTVTSNPGGITATGANSPITVTGLTNGTEYTFTVIASNAAGDGTASSASNAVTPATTPGAPTAVTGTPDNGQVGVAFNAPESNGGAAISGYKVISSPGGFNATGASSPITVTGLTNGTVYTFTVVAVNDVGEGTISAASEGITPRTVPGVPTNASAVTGNGEATIIFTAPESNGGSVITGYKVTSNPGGLTATGASSPITVTGLTNGTEYTFTIVATNAAGDSEASEETNSVIPAAVPDAPAGVGVVPGNGTVQLNWSAPASNGGAITDYIVQYKLGTDSTWILLEDEVSTTTTAIITGLANGSSYDFRVAAVNDVGTSTYSSVVAGIPRTVPGAPTDILPTPGNAQVSLTWTAPTSNGGASITDYVLQYSLSGEEEWSTFSDTETAATTAMVTGLINGTVYDFRVAAVNATGTGAYSTPVTMTPRTTPDAPTNIVAVRGNGDAVISFTAPESTGGAAITGYTVTSNPGGVTATGVSSPITVTGLTNGTEYTFIVEATNIAGKGAASESSNAVVPATIPGVPVSLTAIANEEKVELSWDAPANNGGLVVTDYIVRYKAASQSDWIVYSDGVSSSTTASVNDLTNGTVYEFQVASVNDLGVSAYSATVSSTPRTVPGVPTNLTATPGNRQVGLTWTPPVFNGGATIIDYVVQFSVSGEDDWTTFADGTSAVASATVIGLSNNVDYEFRISAVNVAGAGEPSEPIVSSPAAAYMVISDVQGVPSDSSVIVTWKTDAESNSMVEYGPSANYGKQSALTDEAGVIDHSVTITGLQPCTTYSYRVISEPIEEGNSVTSSNRTITTTGCAGGAEVVNEQIESVSSANGGTVVLISGDREISVDLPQDYADGDAVIQIKKLAGPVLADIGLPVPGIKMIDGHAYEIKAVATDATLVTEFDSVITVGVKYTDDDVKGMDESSLKLYNWHNNAWQELTDCTVNAALNTVQCTTSAFSLFALFGVALPQSEVKPSEPSSNGMVPENTKNTNKGNESTGDPVPNENTQGETSKPSPKPPSAGRDEKVDLGNDKQDGIASQIIWWAVAIVAVIGTVIVVRQYRKG